MRRDGQVAIVTSGGRGIGRAIAQELAESGVSVAIVARTASELDETAALITAAGRHWPFPSVRPNISHKQTGVKDRK